MLCLKMPPLSLHPVGHSFENMIKIKSIPSVFCLTKIVSLLFGCSPPSTTAPNSAASDLEIHHERVQFVPEKHLQKILSKIDSEV